MTAIDIEDSTSRTAYEALIEHTVTCPACLKSRECAQEAELRAANRAERQASRDQCADCGVSGDVAELAAKFFPGMSGPGGPAIPLCGTCIRLRAAEAERQIEEWAQRRMEGS